jgi:hypothetical protein
LPVGRGFSFVLDIARAPPLLDATGLSQQEVFKDEFAFATDKRVTANTARHLSKDRLRSGFDFDDVIARQFVRVKELNDGGLPPAMIRPLYPIPAC